MSDRRNLAIVRAGDGSLHTQWLNRSGEERNWDLIVSYWGDDPKAYRGGDWLRVDSKGLKFQAVDELIRTHGELVRKYDYVWLAEDDLACTCRDINRFFDICHHERLDLAQPALTHDSYFTLAITLESPCFRLRYTSFVEIMAPCFSADALVIVLPTLKESLSGYGLEELWVNLLGEGDSVAIIDKVQMRHTWPVGGGQLYKALEALGKSAWGELEQVFKKVRYHSAALLDSLRDHQVRKKNPGRVSLSLPLWLGSPAGGSATEGEASRVAARLVNCNVSADQGAQTVTRTRAANTADARCIRQRPEGDRRHSRRADRSDRG
ncbi:MAG: DUF707 domain-containing protein [Bryobacteraceae bacterium]